MQRGLETESAIQELKSIMPDFYDEVDNLKDENGNSVDVYGSVTVGFRDNGNIVCGLTSSLYSQNNESISINGTNTVDVQINHSFLSIKGSTLAHEFGHAYFNVKHPFAVRNDLERGISISDPQSFSERYARGKEKVFLEASKKISK